MNTLTIWIKNTKIYKSLQQTVFFRWAKSFQIRSLYFRKNYLEAYSQHTDMRIKHDPHQAVGGLWEKMGKIQLDFLIDHGMKPNHTMLDIGCGTLRGGRHFIKYLEPEKYTGIDISSKAIEYGKKIIKDEHLANKAPKLVLNKNQELKFEELEQNQQFKYILAQSVFTHLMPQHIEQCFQYVGKIMSESSIFFFTYGERKFFEQTTLKDFKYPFSFFQTLADRYHFNIEQVEYKHPRNQRMAMLTKKIS